MRSWIGWATKTRPDRRRAPRIALRRPSMNSVDATNTVGIPRASRLTVSCTLHDVHDPQSASASITMSHFSAISRRRSTGAAFVKVGLAKRGTFTRGRRGVSSSRSRNTCPWGLRRRAGPTRPPSHVAGRGAARPSGRWRCSLAGLEQDSGGRSRPRPPSSPVSCRSGRWPSPDDRREHPRAATGVDDEESAVAELRHHRRLDAAGSPSAIPPAPRTSSGPGAAGAPWLLEQPGL